MKLLVFGQTGQVARELARHLPGDMQAHFVPRAQADLATRGACARIIAQSPADAILNTAAWTDVDAAETQEAAATRINGEAPGEMAKAAAARGLPFLHLSTDYVFDGKGTQPFAPGDATAPVNAYGRTKLAGERAVQAAGGQWLILRTSWVFSPHGRNFVTTMMRLGAARDRLGVVADQIGGPTPAAAIAKALLIAAREMADGAPGGLHHFAGKPETSWADFARAIMARAGLDCAIDDIATADFPRPAPRPLNSRLDCTGFAQAFGVERPDWRDGLDEVIKEIPT